MKKTSLSIKAIDNVNSLYVSIYKKAAKVMVESIRHMFISTKSVEVVLPEMINEMRLVKSLSQKNFPYSVGLYKTSKNKFVVNKVWSGQRKDVHYYNLVKETLTLSVLSGKSARFNDITVKLPKLVGVFEDENNLILSTQYVQGKEFFNTLNINEQYTTYISLLNCFKKLYLELSKEEIKLIGMKNRTTVFAQFPILLVLSLIKRPYLIKLLAKACKGFLYSGWNTREIDYSIAHGDIHSKNLLLSKDNKIYLLDFEQTVITSNWVDISASVSSKHLHPEFKEKILSSINEITDCSGKFEFSFFALYSTLYNLVSYKKNNELAQYIDVLNRSIEISAKAKELLQKKQIGVII